MSGRFSFYYLPEVLQQELPELSTGFVARWNISPRQQVTLLRQTGGVRQTAQALWGFTPRWSKDMSHVATHARAETVLQQDFFAPALASQRGVLLANGFFEWRGPAGTRKQPYWLSREDEPLYMAALWEPYPVAGHEYLSVAMLTVAAAYLRRPLLLTRVDLDDWLNPATDPARITGLLQGNMLALRERKVSTLVNDPQSEGPECIRPVQAARSLR